MFDAKKKLFRFLVTRADAARDAQKFEAASTLYAEALQIRPDHAGVHVQHGHMLKETGRFDLAFAAYTEAERLRPDDADLAMQIGHLHKVAGRLQEAGESYAKALTLKPGWGMVEQELQIVQDLAAAATPRAGSDRFHDTSAVNRSDLASMSAKDLSRLVPALIPRLPQDIFHSHQEEISVRRLGRREAGFWGTRPTLRGLEALRGFCVSRTPVVEVEVYLNGLRISRGPLSGGYELKLEIDRQRLKKYVFNLWIDFSEFSNGLCSLELRFHHSDAHVKYFHDEVVIAPAPSETDFPDSPHVVTIDHRVSTPIEEQVRARPSMVRSAKRDLFPDGVRSVAVLRTDQLGDVVASIPAMLRLREMAPAAHIVGIFTPANADLARTLPMLDEVIIIDFPDDPLERRRLMPLDQQEQLRRNLETYQFDIAIDLAQAPVSRDLLRLTGAKFTYGTGGGDWPWLSADFQFHTPDRWTRHDSTPHSTNVLAFVEALGAILKTSAPIIRRDDLSREMLQAYGLAPDANYVLLHMGARISFSRWPYYADLAQMFLDNTDLTVVMMTEDRLMRMTMPAKLMTNDRVIYLEERLPFNHFDAFVSFATVMTGNDSGPKHLASLRGTQVVTIFSARINWTEWGQENVGSIISRRVPCAGCALLHDPEECGRGFVCVTDIKSEEVFAAMMSLIDQNEGRSV